ncbi:AmmeMemoRadiSam system radical SAM enzyme [Litorilinea aerophila]|nr:AmmeMemoRadiSam system radical SAM enzyme [Litorilinea aerophila]MCC9076749.1 AmmeMemoRadiSam system radical SAM enzyme [Litorilinea aerophila]
MMGNGSTREMIAPGVVRGSWWHRLADGRIQCDLCPRYCRLRPGQRGFCFVRQADEEGMLLTSYGRASGFCIDPIEKKPLNHFYPGSSVLSFGTAGCNLGCRFCQNWDISKARQDDRLSDWAAPERIAQAARQAGCRSVAFTYNDPVIFAEFAIDTARACHELGLKTVAVTAGYITPEARRDFYAVMDAANVDLKAFTEDFYHKLCFAHLQPVLDTLIWLVHETDVWVEVTTLLIPGHNDSEAEIARLCDWFVEHLGPDVPLHFTAFHPDFKMMDVPHTPAATLRRARQQALAAGLHHVYTGNVWDREGQSTYCAGCGRLLIERNWYHLGAWNLDEQGCCRFCGTRLAGHFEARPEQWGPRRERLFL